MSILNRFFNKLNPEVGTNWLSVKYAHWYYSRQGRYNREFMKKPHVPIESFDVAGAGNICLSENPCHLTARTYGFGVYVSWGHNSLYSGGVMGLEEARRLANFILERCNKIEKSESELVNERYGAIVTSSTI